MVNSIEYMFADEVRQSLTEKSKRSLCKKYVVVTDDTIGRWGQSLL